MIPKPERLILELILLVDRYSDKDVKQAQRLLRSNSKSEMLASIGELLGVSLHRPERMTTKRSFSEEISVEQRKKSILDGIAGESNTVEKRSRRIADQLGLKWEPGKQQNFFKLVSGQLNAMTDDEFIKTFINDRNTGGADEAYMNLASFLVGNQDNEKS